MAKIKPSPKLPAFPITLDVNRLFADFFERPIPYILSDLAIEPAGFRPLLDIYEEKDEVIVKAELPGIRKEDIDITLTPDTITISGEKRKEENVERKNCYQWECSYGSFSRILPLPAEVQTEKVKAQFRNGVLEIRIPKTEEAIKKEKKVKVE